MKNKDSFSLENAYMSIYSKVIKESHEDEDEDLMRGSTNFPHGDGYPNKPKDFEKIVRIDHYVDAEDFNEELKYPLFITAYDVTRAYGGHEEGGWWYDDYSVINSDQAFSAEEAVQIATRFYEDNIESTDGKLEIVAEKKQGSQESEAPRYE